MIFPKQGMTFGILLALVAPAALLQAEAPREYTPYRVRIWVAAAPATRMDRVAASGLRHLITQQAERIAAAAWNATIEEPPREIFARQVFALEQMRPHELLAVDKDLLKIDKLLLATLSPGEGGIRVQARELDCRTLELGETVSHFAPQEFLLPHVTFDALADVFTPVARMENPKGDTIRLHLQAGGLVRDSHSPAAVQPGDLFQPVLRQNDRKGQARQGGIRAIPFTYLKVEANEEGRISSTLLTGARSMLGSRSSGRTERLALRVKPRANATMVVVKTPDTRSPQGKIVPGKPLAGYRISERIDAGGPLAPIGFTDWRGQFLVESAPDRALRQLYVANGELPLARLPLVPGHERRVWAVVNDDDPRIEAEGFVLAFQGRVLDILVQRTELAARAKRRLAEGKTDEAQSLVQRLRELPNRNQLTVLLETGERRVLTDIPKGSVEKKVGMMFEECRRQLATFLANDPADEISAAIQAASPPKKP